MSPLFGCQQKKKRKTELKLCEGEWAGKDITARAKQQARGTKPSTTTTTKNTNERNAFRKSGSKNKKKNGRIPCIRMIIVMIIMHELHGAQARSHVGSECSHTLSVLRNAEMSSKY